MLPREMQRRIGSIGTLNVDRFWDDFDARLITSELVKGQSRLKHELRG